MGCWQLLQLSTSFTALIIELDVSEQVADSDYWWPINNTIPYCQLA